MLATCDALIRHSLPTAEQRRVGVGAMVESREQVEMLGVLLPTEEYILHAGLSEGMRDPDLRIMAPRDLLEKLAAEKFAGTALLEFGAWRIFLSLVYAWVEGSGSCALTVENVDRANRERLAYLLQIVEGLEVDRVIDQAASGAGVLETLPSGWSIRSLKRGNLSASRSFPQLSNMFDWIGTKLDVIGGVAELGSLFYGPTVRPRSISEVLSVISPHTGLVFSFNPGLRRLWVGTPEEIARRLAAILDSLQRKQWVALRWAGFDWGRTPPGETCSLVARLKRATWTIEAWGDTAAQLREAQTQFDAATINNAGPRTVPPAV